MLFGMVLSRSLPQDVLEIFMSFSNLICNHILDCILARIFVYYIIDQINIFLIMMVDKIRDIIFRNIL